MIQFVINKQGKVINTTVYKGIHTLVDEEAIRVINELPNWVPAQKNGKNVCQTYVMPVNFRIN